MRTVISIALLLLFVTPYFLGPSWLRMEKRQIQKHVRNTILPTIDDSELISLTFSSEDTLTELRWKHAKEFEFQGRMYDIVKRNRQENSITYLVWQDDEETEINTKIKQLTNTIFNTSSDSKNSQLTFQLMVKTLYFPPLLNWECAFSVPKMNHTYYYKHDVQLSGYLCSVFNPPQV